MSSLADGLWDRRYRRWLVGVERRPHETLSVSRAISGQRSIPLIFLSVSWSSAFRLDPLRNDPRQPGEGRRRWYGSHRLSRPSAMHELFLVSYLGGAISTARKPPTLYRAINRRETERKRGGSDVDAHAIPRRSPALCSQYRARPAKIGL